MIVADDQHVAEYLRLLLLAHDYEVLSLQASVEVIVRIEQMLPEVLLCDTEQSEDMETLRQIRGRLATPVIHLRLPGHS